MSRIRLSVHQRDALAAMCRESLWSETETIRSLIRRRLAQRVHGGRYSKEHFVVTALGRELQQELSTRERRREALRTAQQQEEIP